MTDEKRIMVAVLALAELVGRELTEAGLAMYVRGLSGLTADQVEAAVDHAARTVERGFMPMPAELRKSIEGDVESRALAAWHVLDKATIHGPYKHIDFDDPLINAVVRSLGGWVWCFDQRGDTWDVWARKEFLRVYSAMYSGGMVHGDACKPLEGIGGAGVYDVQKVDGTIAKIEVGEPLRISTGLPALPGDVRKRIGVVRSESRRVGPVVNVGFQKV